MLETQRTLAAYINAFVTTNARDVEAQARQNELQPQHVRLAQMGTRFTVWIGSLDVEALIARTPTE